MFILMLQCGSVSPETSEDQTANKAQTKTRAGPRAKDDHCHQEVHDRNNHQETPGNHRNITRRPPGTDQDAANMLPPIQRWDQGQNQEMTMVLCPMSSGPWAKCLPLLCTGGIQTHCVRIYMESEVSGDGAREGLCKSWSKRAIALYMHCTATPHSVPAGAPLGRERASERERDPERST